eukprot:CAMPEP_0174383992 /NCGR_PEP_ID=MMETSP0811_2-20130205/125614_1 /TAXON_ID=73025 ORGANISM="Eutreptiella gymnastica-like, Strain CCMP1594" /NCGR_SAMPLE_ID=MMETSP0811_2 /ASSEMBLY_ACC=CAM_ASM_000667 /LENGTH=273 /DNA_ID=CAMNT_0015537789 /DNA_START=1278 /DNA_END=2100 /DNA_ORIENTATION=+
MSETHGQGVHSPRHDAGGQEQATRPQGSTPLICCGGLETWGACQRTSHSRCAALVMIAVLCPPSGLHLPQGGEKKSGFGTASSMQPPCPRHDAGGQEEATRPQGSTPLICCGGLEARGDGPTPHRSRYAAHSPNCPKPPDNFHPTQHTILVHVFLLWLLSHGHKALDTNGEGPGNPPPMGPRDKQSAGVRHPPQLVAGTSSPEAPECPASDFLQQLVDPPQVMGVTLMGNIPRASRTARREPGGGGLIELSQAKVLMGHLGDLRFLTGSGKGT